MTERTTPGLEPCPHCELRPVVRSMRRELVAAPVDSACDWVRVESMCGYCGPWRRSESEAVAAHNAVSRAVQSQRALDALPEGGGEEAQEPCKWPGCRVCGGPRIGEPTPEQREAARKADVFHYPQQIPGEPRRF